MNARMNYRHAPARRRPASIVAPVLALLLALAALVWLFVIAGWMW